MPVHLDAGGEVRTPVSASEVGHGRVIADAEGYVRQSAAAARGGLERRRRTVKAAGGGRRLWCGYYVFFFACALKMNPFYYECGNS